MNCGWCNKDIDMHTETQTTFCLKKVSESIRKHVLMLRSVL